MHKHDVSSGGVEEARNYSVEEQKKGESSNKQEILRKEEGKLQKLSLIDLDILSKSRSDVIFWVCVWTLRRVRKKRTKYLGDTAF